LHAFCLLFANEEVHLLDWQRNRPAFFKAYWMHPGLKGSKPQDAQGFQKVVRALYGSTAAEKDSTEYCVTFAEHGEMLQVVL
jgi:hypothetical protein